MRRLPPLTAIEAFVQVARLGSVKAAAEALSLSSPALTRRRTRRPWHTPRSRSSPNSTQGCGQGFGLHPFRPLVCCIITGARRPGPGQYSCRWPSTCPTSWLTRYRRYAVRS